MIKTFLIPWVQYGGPIRERRIAEILANRLMDHVASVKIKETKDGDYQLYTRRGPVKH